MLGRPAIVSTLIPIISLGLLPGCFDLLGEPGNGDRATETRSVSAFSAIESGSSLDVDVRQGEAFAVTVSIDSNLIDRVETRVAGQTLIVDVHGGITRYLGGPHVMVTMPVLAGAAVSGSGALRIHPFTQDAEVALRASGSGDVQAESAVAPRVRADVSGSGNIRVAGTTQRIDIDVSGSGDVDAVDLDATEGSADISGSGSASATIHGSADVSISGSGDLDLFGGATIAHLSQSGSGSLHVRP